MNNGYSIYNKIDTTNYFHNISCDNFDSKSIPIIKSKLVSLKSIYVNKYLQNILNRIQYDIDNESPEFLSMVDYYLFNLNKMPIVSIHNSNAVVKKNKKNITEYYSKTCQLNSCNYNCIIM
jgi:3-methyladenine DNA glycosylase AlkC